MPSCAAVILDDFSRYMIAWKLYGGDNWKAWGRSEWASRLTRPFCHLPSADDAMEQSLGADSQWLVVSSTVGKLIPAEYIPLLEEMHSDGHDLQISYKNAQRSCTLVERANQLDFFDWLHNRAARLWGTPKVGDRRLAELDTIWFSQWCLWQDNGNGEAADVPAILDEAMRAMNQC